MGADTGNPRPKCKRGSAPAPPPELSTGQPLLLARARSPAPSTYDWRLTAVQTRHALFLSLSSPDTQTAAMLLGLRHPLSAPALTLALTLALLVRSASPGE